MPPASISKFTVNLILGYLIFKVIFIWKYIKIIYIFYFLKFIFNINLSKQFKNKKY